MRRIELSTIIWPCLGAAAIALCIAGVPSAGAEEKRADAGIPEPVGLEQFNDLFENSPFRRHLSLSDSLVLSGVATLPAGDVVTVLNPATDETFVVSDSPNAQGWKLIDLANDRNLTKVSARISASGQVLTLRFDPQRLAPEKIKTRAKPGTKTVENTVVEALLKDIDQESATSFELLKPKQQEQFRTSLAKFLNSYPEASDPRRIEFIRTTLSTMKEPGEEPGEGDDDEADPNEAQLPE